MTNTNEIVPNNNIEPITIFVRGGVIQDIWQIPEGITVRVQDYDIDGLTAEEEAQLQQDHDGFPCFIAVWEGTVKHDEMP
jgi:hypothetical protein